MKCLGFFLLTLSLCYTYTIENLPHSSIPPTKRSYNQLIRTNSSLISFGGSSTTKLQEIWEFDIASNKWREISPTTTARPGERIDTGGFTLEDGKSFCVFGGLGLKGDLQDLWCFRYEGSRVSAI